MATRLGSHAARLRAVRSLRVAKSRRSERRFSFEGPTLLREAQEAGFPIDEIYATPLAYDANPRLRELDAAGVPLFIIAESAAASISDVASPTGILAVAPMRLSNVEQLLQKRRPVLVLADLNDPANAGMLLRSANAFGAGGALFGALGVDPYHPKVVRGSMGAIFRVRVGIAEPEELGFAARATGTTIVGLDATGTPLSRAAIGAAAVIVVGHERKGLGRWSSLCERVLAIPMQGRAESLSAAVAGSIALFEAMHAMLDFPCQDSQFEDKSQDYRR